MSTAAHAETSGDRVPRQRWEADGREHAPQWIVTIKEGTEALFRDRADVFMAGDLLWYPVEGDNEPARPPNAGGLWPAQGRSRPYMQGSRADRAQVVFEDLRATVARRCANSSSSNVGARSLRLRPRYRGPARLAATAASTREVGTASSTSARLGSRFEPGEEAGQPRIDPA